MPVPVKNVRPRARVKLDVRDIEAGQKVMLNYNYDEPENEVIGMMPSSPKIRRKT